MRPSLRPSQLPDARSSTGQGDGAGAHLGSGSGADGDDLASEDVAAAVAGFFVAGVAVVVVADVAVVVAVVDLHEPQQQRERREDLRLIDVPRT